MLARPEFRELNLIDQHPVSKNSHGRGGTGIDGIFLHTSEGAGGMGLVDFMARKSVSYHYVVDNDPDGNTVFHCVDTDRASWSVLDANNRSINIVIGRSFARWSRGEWLRNARKAVRIAAWLAAQNCRKYGIESRVIAPPYPTGLPGISDHKFVTQKLRIGDHVDVGNNFIWAEFAANMAEFTGAAPPSEESELRDDERQWLREIRDKMLAYPDAEDLPPEHRGKWPSRARCRRGTDGVDDTVGMGLYTDANVYDLLIAWSAVELGDPFALETITLGVEGKLPANDEASLSWFRSVDAKSTKTARASARRELKRADEAAKVQPEE